MKSYELKAVIDKWQDLLTIISVDDMISYMMRKELYDVCQWFERMTSRNKSKNRQIYKKEKILECFTGLELPNAFDLLIDALSTTNGPDSTPIIDSLLQRQCQLAPTNSTDLDRKALTINAFIPPLPNCYVTNFQAENHIIETLQDLKIKNLNGWIVLYGSQGIGKTALVNQFVRNQAMTGDYSSGVIWISLGQTKMNQTLTVMQQLLKRLNRQECVIPSTMTSLQMKISSLIENQPIRPFVVLDDVREANQLLYLNFNCDTIVTTRNADIASKLNREKCVIHIKELLTVEHCRNVMASTAKIPISTLPKAVDQFIEIVDHSALILTLFGILVQHDKDKWNISDNKWLNQYQSQYDTKTMLHKLIDMLLSNLNESDLNLILKLDIFEENTIIPINTLSMYWGVNQHYCISIMNSLVHRFLATENVVNTKNIGYSLNDYMADYIRSRHCVSDAKANHVTLLDLYKKSCQGDWVQLRNDDYIHDHLVDHVIGADDKKTMKELLKNFKWLQIRLKNKSSYALLHDFIKSRSILDFEEWNHLHDYWYLVRDSHSSINLCQDGSLIQLALSRPWWRDFYKEVESKAIEDCKETTFFKWNNSYNQRNEFQICIATLEPTSESITSSCFSSDGTMLACCDKIGNIIIYDTILWTPLYSFHSTKGKISNCSFSPDCQKIALSFHCGKTEVWNINNEKILIEHGYHTAKVNWSEFSPSGQEVVSCSDDRLIMIWNSNTGNNIVTCRGHKNMVIDCHYSKDGGRILSCSWDKTIQIWDTTFGTSLLVCAITEDWPIFCSFLDHDQHIMCGCEHRVYIWDSSTGDAIDKLTSTCRDRVSLYDVTANGKMAVRCLFGSNLVEVIDTSSGQTSIVTDDGHHDLITCAKISPNSKIIATTSKDTLLKLWLVQPFKENMEKADKKPMHLLDCSFIGNVPHIISGEYEQWEGQAIESFIGKDVRFVKETCKEDWKCVKCCSLSHNGNLLAVGFAFGKVKMLHHDNLEVDWSINNLQLHVNNLTFNSTDEVLMVSISTDPLDSLKQFKIIIVNSINGDIVNKFISEDQICFYKFLESSNILLIGAARGEMQAYNIYENSKSIDSLSIPGKIIHHDLALDDAECAVILEDKDSKACIVWNCVSFKITHTVDSNTCISTCKFSTKCDKLAIGYDYGTFKIWETTSWTLLTSFDGHLGSIQTLYFSADDKIILTGGKCITWWDLTENKVMQQFPLQHYANVIKFNDSLHTVIIDDGEYLYVLSHITPIDRIGSFSLRRNLRRK